eukprot:Nk52_evm46s914 gene=Nk52_evmTU46s914
MCESDPIRATIKKDLRDALDAAGVLSSLQSKGVDLQPDRAQALPLWALCNQKQTGDCNMKKPGFTDVRGKFKYNAWMDLKGMSKEEAAKKYDEQMNVIVESFRVKC